MEPTLPARDGSLTLVALMARTNPAKRLLGQLGATRAGAGSDSSGLVIRWAWWVLVLAGAHL